MSEVVEPTTECGFCIDGKFRVRARGGRPARAIPCPYCGGSGRMATVELELPDVRAGKGGS